MMLLSTSVQTYLYPGTSLLQYFESHLLFHCWLLSGTNVNGFIECIFQHRWNLHASIVLFLLLVRCQGKYISLFMRPLSYAYIYLELGIICIFQMSSFITSVCWIGYCQVHCMIQNAKFTDFFLKPKYAKSCKTSPTWLHSFQDLDETEPTSWHQYTSCILFVRLPLSSQILFTILFLIFPWKHNMYCLLILFQIAALVYLQQPTHDIVTTASDSSRV